MPNNHKQDIDSRHWADIYKKCSWSTAFASPLWQVATNEFAEDSSFMWNGIFTPLKKIKLAKGFLTGYESTVPGVPAGPISQETPDEGTIKAYWEELRQRTKGRFLIHLRKDSPFCKTPFKTVTVKNHILRIKDRKNLISTHHKRKIKKAQNSGITVNIARRDSDLDIYWEMYENSIRTWDKKPSRIYPRIFFERVKEILIPAGAAKFFMAWHKGKPQAGALLLFEKNRALYWHGVRAADCLNETSVFLNWSIMDNLQEDIEYYDFGPSPGLKGVSEFKKRFGADIEEQITVLGPSRIFSSYFLKRANLDA